MAIHLKYKYLILFSIKIINIEDYTYSYEHIIIKFLIIIDLPFGVEKAHNHHIISENTKFTRIRFF